MRGRWLLISTLVATACVVAGTASAAEAAAKPVIGRAVASAVRPLPGKRFSVSFHVTRARTVAFSVTLGAARVRHSDSFRAGTARTTFVTPNVSGVLRVKLTARRGRAVSTKQVSYSVRVTPPPSLSIADASATEGTSGTTPMAFQVALSRASNKPVSVQYATSDGTATAPADYTSASGTLTFNPGETTKTISVSIVGDQSIEPDEQFSVTLSNPVCATVSPGSATGTIHTHNIPSVGNWQVATQEGNYVYFTVNADGTVTLFRSNSLTENCNDDTELQGSVDWGTQSFQIGSDGTLAADYSGSGPPSDNGVQYTAESWKIAGTFTTTTISGTISLSDQLTYQGSSYDCSGSVTFTATFQG